LCHAESIDLVHASDPWLTPYALAIGTQLGVPTIGHVRGPVPPETLRKYNLKKCTGVITVATRYQSNLRSAGVTQDRMAVIEDSVALDRFSPDLRSGNLFREEFSVGEKIAIGLVGRIEPFKKCLEWVEMVAECSHELPNAIFFIIGHASSERYAREVSNSIARHNLQRHVILTGRREDIPQALAGLDILVTLSGGSVMFEALAVGTPVLSIHERGQFSDHTIDGLTAKCYSGSCMKKAAMTLVAMALDSDFRAQLGSRAAAHAKARLSSPLMAKKTADFYRAILG
jgi:glycosyltransferase involved in cell wall biosynthesis